MDQGYHSDSTPSPTDAIIESPPQAVSAPLLRRRRLFSHPDSADADFSTINPHPPQPDSVIDPRLLNLAVSGNSATTQIFNLVSAAPIPLRIVPRVTHLRIDITDTEPPALTGRARQSRLRKRKVPKTKPTPKARRKTAGASEPKVATDQLRYHRRHALVA